VHEGNHFWNPSFNVVSFVVAALQCGSLFSKQRHFNFTNSSTKIAQIPTVMGNCTTMASRIAPPLGRANVSNIMARAVNIPTRNFPLAFIQSTSPFPFPRETARLFR
jgi:hypothetical protein